MTTPVLPSKSDLNGNPTAGTWKTAMGTFYDYVEGIVASMIPFTASGNIVATDVETAINELDAEKIQIPASIAQGDLIYRGASAFERLPAGTSGQVLKTNGPSANPEWITPVTSGGVQGAFKNLKIQVTSNTLATITVDQIVLFDSTNNAKLASAVSAILNTATTGANGLDTGTLATSTWYYTYVIFGTSGTACLMSASATAPTLPSGYSYFARVGALKCDSSKYLMRTLQLGRKVQYVVTPSTNTANLPIMASGTAGNTTTPTWVTVSTSSFIAPTALSITGSVFISYLGGVAMVSPNNSYGTFNNTANLPVASSSSGTSATAGISLFNFLLESTNVYWASAGSAVLTCLGWEDNL